MTTALQLPLPGVRVRKRQPAKEVRTHIALADLLEIDMDPRWWSSHLPFGGKRTKATGDLLKRMGTKPGMADFVLIGPDGRHHYLELKRGRAVLEESQKDFRAAMIARGVRYAVARSYDEAVAILTGWGALRGRVRHT